MLRYAIAVVCLLVGLIILNGAALEWYGMRYQFGWYDASLFSEGVPILVWTGAFILAFLTCFVLMGWCYARASLWVCTMLFVLTLAMVADPYLRDAWTRYKEPNGDHSEWKYHIHTSKGVGLYEYPAPPYDFVPHPITRNPSPPKVWQWYLWGERLVPVLYALLGIGLALCVAEHLRLWLRPTRRVPPQGSAAATGTG